MNYTKFTDLVFNELPEFKKFYKEDLDVNYYNLFMGDLGLFVRNSVLNEELYSNKLLVFINNLYNENYLNKEFINMLNINILEVLTDTVETQKESLKIFTSFCLQNFKNLLQDTFNDLT